MPKSYSKQFSLYDSGLILSSVEQLPTASASVAFTVDSGKVFREDADIVPATLSNGIQYMPWGWWQSLADHTMADEAKIQAVRNLYDDLHIADDCTEAINAYYAEARKALDNVALPQAQKAPLWEYAASLLGRTK